MFRVEEIEQRIEQVRQITVMLNGNPMKRMTMQLRNPPFFTQIQRMIESKWNIRLKHLRIFNGEGLEYLEDDLKYIKPKQNIYVSRGEDFDASSNMAEYQIVEPLGEGGYGKVYLARHQVTRQLVAIKVMKTDSLQNAHQIDLVFRQAQNLKALNHPNIVRIFSCYSLPGMQMVFVMEYMEGGQLLELLKSKQRFDEQQAKIYFRQIVSAISHCHYKNIVHRDLKLQNILLKDKTSMAVKVADFGISGVADRINPDADVGTLFYMAPEILSGKEKGNSPTVDVWAMGCILYAMLVGTVPFVGENNNQTFKLITEGSYKIPSRIALTKQAVSIVSKMLDINPSTRIKIQQIQAHPWLNSKQKLFESSGQQKKTRFLPQINKDSKKTTVINLIPPKGPIKSNKKQDSKLVLPLKKISKRPILRSVIMANQDSIKSRDNRVWKESEHKILSGHLNCKQMPLSLPKNKQNVRPQRLGTKHQKGLITE